MNSPLTIMRDMDGIPNIIFKYGIYKLHRTRNALTIDKDEIAQNLVKKNLDIIILSMLNDNPVHGYKLTQKGESVIRYFNGAKNLLSIEEIILSR